jgi:hypothetical protein
MYKKALRIEYIRQQALYQDLNVSIQWGRKSLVANPLSLENEKGLAIANSLKQFAKDQMVSLWIQLFIQKDTYSRVQDS